jgi:hypothetical protein
LLLFNARDSSGNENVRKETRKSAAASEEKEIDRRDHESVSK